MYNIFYDRLLGLDLIDDSVRLRDTLVVWIEPYTAFIDRDPAGQLL